MRKPKCWLTALFLGASTCALFGQALQQLPTNFLEPGDLYGASAAISGNGNYIVVGAPGHRNFEDPAFEQEGVAFVYVLSGSGWMLQDTLHHASDLADNDKMGAAVAANADGSIMAVGSPGAGQDRGDVWLFRRSGSDWTMLQPLAHTGPPSSTTGASPNDMFGSVVALDGSGLYLGVGSPLHHHFEGRANVCLYGAAGWVSYASFDNPEPSMGDGFGAAISFDQTASYLVIGAPGEDNGFGIPQNTTDFYGAVYFYKRSPFTPNSWTQVQKIKPSNLQPQSHFGASLDLSNDGDVLIVGAPGHDNDAGAAFIFTRTGDTWTEIDMIAAYNPAAEDDFGRSVALTGDGDIAMAGAPVRDTASVSGAGAAFLFRYANPSAKWAQYKTLALPPGYEPEEAFSFSLSIASNLSRGVISSPYRDGIRGAAFVLTESALPVTWLNFRASLEGNDVHLTWSTASESNNEGFDVQRSENGRDWQTIAFVPGAGTTSEVQTYSYTDPSPFT
ncbi:MAG: FG-GAP repeat protein, partial [Saprospiraceae bacterium]